MDVSLADGLSFIKDAGALGVLVIAVYGLFKKWWVPYWVYEVLEEENRDLRAALIKSTGNIGTAIDLVKKP